MANPEHLALLKRGVEAWNEWRQANSDIKPDLIMADFHGADLSEADLHEATLVEAVLSGVHLCKASLRGADLREADLREASLTMTDLRGATLTEAKLHRANLSKADLSKADLRAADLTMTDLRGAVLYGADLRRAILSGAALGGVNLREADFRGVNLREVDLRGADLTVTDLRGAVLYGADLNGAILYETIFSDTHLAGVKGLDTCKHKGPSTLDFRTLQKSGPLPRRFLRRCGLPDLLIDYLPSLRNQPIQYYSCFISYSSKDEDFAQRLCADLENKGVRCWFAPEDIPIGAKFRDAIDEGIREQDKVILILSEHAVSSVWVEKEVEAAFEEEQRRRELLLIPIRLDDAVKTASASWAADIKRTRQIGDFSGWKNDDSYTKALNRLLHDLRRKSN